MIGTISFNYNNLKRQNFFSVISAQLTSSFYLDVSSVMELAT